MKVEFGSSAWIAKAEEFLWRLVEAHNQIKAERFVATENFTNAPPHLLPPGETNLTWSFEVDDGVARVSRGRVPNPTLVVDLDYSAALPAARAIYDTPPIDSSARQGPTVVQRSVPKGGMLTASPAMLALLRDLHNELARITA